MYAARIRYGGDIQQFSFEMGRIAEVVSVGTSLDIIKDVGKPYEIVPNHEILNYDGSHGLGHTRLATESGVHPNTSHPFWAPGFADATLAAEADCFHWSGLAKPGQWIRILRSGRSLTGSRRVRDLSRAQILT